MREGSWRPSTRANSLRKRSWLTSWTESLATWQCMQNMSCSGQAWAGGRSEDKWGTRHRTEKKKEAHKTTHPNATRPKNRERQHGEGGAKSNGKHERKKEEKTGSKTQSKKKKKGRGAGEAKGRPGPQKQGHPVQKGERKTKPNKKKNMVGTRGGERLRRGGDRNDGKEPTAECLANERCGLQEDRSCGLQEGGPARSVSTESIKWSKVLGRRGGSVWWAPSPV